MLSSKTIRKEASSGDVLAASVRRPTDRRQLLERVKTGALAFTTLYVVLALLGRIFSSDPPPAELPGNSNIGQSSLVASFALNFTRDYLQASQANQTNLSRYISADTKPFMPPTSRRFTDAEVVFVKQRAQLANALTMWTVTISGRLSTQPSVSTGLSYFQVPVTLFNSAPRAIDYPKQVEAPSLGVDLPTAYTIDIPQQTALGQAATGFIRAYLTGAEDINRYADADSNIKAIDPKPFANVAFAERSAVTAVDTPTDTEGAEARVRVVAYGRTSTGDQLQMPYQLTARFVSGKWYVVSVDSTPAVATAEPQGQKSTTQAPASTTTVPPAKRGN